MELEPTFLMRQAAMFRARTSPRRWLLPYLKGSSFLNFVALFFVRWVVIILWTIPTLLIGAVLFIALFMPLLFVWYVAAALFDLIAQRDWPLRERPLVALEVLVVFWLQKSLSLELWLEEEL